MVQFNYWFCCRLDLCRHSVIDLLRLPWHSLDGPIPSKTTTLRERQCQSKIRYIATVIMLFQISPASSDGKVSGPS